MNLVKIDWAAKIRDGSEFYYIRVGDGEFMCIQGIRAFNCDRNLMGPDIGQSVAETLKLEPDPRLIFGVSGVGQAVIDDQVRALLNPDHTWTDASQILEEAISGDIQETLDAINEQDDVILIGPASHWHVGRFIKKFRHIKTPPRDVFSEREKIIDELQEMIAPGSLVIASASFAAPEIGRTLYEGDVPVRYWDVGSLWDGMIGPPFSYFRSWFRDMPYWKRKK